MVLATELGKLGTRIARFLLGRDRLAAMLHKRGKALLDLGRLEESLASCDSALRIKPDLAEAFYSRGNALMGLARTQEARASYQRAVELEPGYADAHYNHGLALQRLRRAQDALASYDRALALKPDDAEALNNRGNVLVELKRPDLALPSYERALSIRPDYVNACYNLGLALQEAGRPDEAARRFERVLELAPEYPFAKGKLLHAMMLCCNWSRLPRLADTIEADVLAGNKAAEPFVHQGVSGSARAMRVCAETYSAENFPPASAPLWRGERYDNRRIRIGYVSGEFREQATAILIALTLYFEWQNYLREYTTLIGAIVTGAVTAIAMMDLMRHPHTGAEWVDLLRWRRARPVTATTDTVLGSTLYGSPQQSSGTDQPGQGTTP